MVINSQKVLLGCVTDSHPRFVQQGLHLVQSLRWFAGQSADADILVCFIGSLDPKIVEQFERLGARLQLVQAHSAGNPFANKIRFLEQPQLAAYDMALLLDCDMLVMQDPLPWLLPGLVQAKTADVPSVPLPLLTRLYKHFDLAVPAPAYRTTFDAVPTLWYCNSGALAVPVRFLPGLLPPWNRYESALRANPSLLDPAHHHSQQAALSLAMAATGLPFRELPVEMNFPLHLTHLTTPGSMQTADPVILHYHDRVDAGGFLMSSPYQGADKRIRQFNARLLAERRAERDAPVPATTTVLCVLGVHRSGTSLVAQALHTLGVDLGPFCALMPGGIDNPNGFWEHTGLLHVNDEILSRLGGSWHAPPELPAGWEQDPILGDLYDRARAIIENDFGAVPVWGWKDPRTSLLLPFWQRLLPEMRYVICVRNPLDVALSLAHRDTFGMQQSLVLWVTYLSHALAHSTGRPRLFIGYEEMTARPECELLRLVAFAGLPELDKQSCPQSAAKALVDLELHHYHTRQLAVAVASQLPAAVKAFYAALVILAEQSGREPDADDTALAAALDEMAAAALRSLGEHHALQASLVGLPLTAEQRKGILSAADEEADKRERTSAILRAKVAAQEKALRALRHSAAERRQELHDLKNQLAGHVRPARLAIADSATAATRRLARLLHSAARRAVPQGSPQQRLLAPVWRQRRATVVMEGCLDLPAPGGDVFGSLEVAGWAFSQVGTIKRIDVYLGEILLGNASYGWLRPDVVAALPHIHDRSCGFHAKLRLDTNGEADFCDLLRVDIVDSAGNHLSFERPIDVLRPSP
jgi:hypothetical protein